MGRGGIIFGGTFNPLHVAHMRVAIDALERLAPFADRLDFVPVANPPHKNIAGVLPFEWRSEIICSVISPYPRMKCSDVEARREGYSYTFETLRTYREERPGEELYFLLGSADYALLPTWRKGLELRKYANLVVIPRGDFNERDFTRLTSELWPAAIREIRRDDAGERIVAEMKDGCAALYLPSPELDISSSLIRKLWLAGKNIDFLTPPETRDLLAKKRDVIITHYWRDNKC